MANKNITKSSSGKWNIFFSWQSDLPEAETTRVIRKAIKKARSKIENNFENVNINIEEATSNTPGSPDIPKIIFEKILLSDIFICDVTTINFGNKVKRVTPNPNVLIELGFASAVLGWERIVMVFNKAFGDFPKDVPFDIDRKRISDFTFSISQNDKYLIQLEQILTDAIKIIINKNPLRPHEKKHKTQKEQQRQRDIENLKWLFSYVNIPTMDSYFTKLPRSFTDKALYFFESFEYILNGNLFYIYDKKLRILIDRFFNHWEYLFSFDGRYRYIGYTDTYVFDIPGDVFPSEDAEKDYKTIETERDKIIIVFRDLLDYIRNEYFEIDLTALSQKAIDDYIEFNNEITEKTIFKNS